MKIFDNDSLLNLSGLECLKTVNGHLYIRYNDHLISFSGLDSLKIIREGFSIVDNSKITDITSLTTLDSVGGGIYISNNGALLSFNGLQNISEIDYLHIDSNESIINLVGFEGLTEAGGVIINNNNSLVNLEGLDNLSVISGNLNIWENVNLVSLEGLESLTAIDVDMYIGGKWYPGNASLVNLNGLNNLENVGGNLIIEYNDAIESLDGLESLTSIGEGLKIKFSKAIVNLSALLNLTTIGGPLTIFYNSVLPDLSGLDNIEANTISGLTIEYNPSLSTCNILSICEYLVAPNGYTNIDNNDTGCNSIKEVEDSCVWIGVEEPELIITYSIYPNPATSEIHLRSSFFGARSSVLIYDMFGRQQEEIQIPADQGQVSIDVSDFLPGIYIIILRNENGMLRRRKFVVK